MSFSSRQWWRSLSRALVCSLLRENILVLDIFFEALNYEKIEQKKAYEIAGLLGEFRIRVGFGMCSSLPTRLASNPFSFHLYRRHFQNLMLLQSHICPDETSEYDWLLWMIVLRLIWGRLNWKWQHMELFHAPLFGLSTHSRLSVFAPRWYWRSDGAVYRSQCFNNTGNIWLPVWGTVIIFNSKRKCMRFFL